MQSGWISRAWRTLLFLPAATALGAAGATVLVAGWLLAVLLAITPLVVPALVGLRAAAGGVARAEAALADALLGTELGRIAVGSPGPSGFWRRGLNVLRDAAFWKQQSYILVTFLLAGALAIGELSLLATGLGAIAQPIDYPWTNENIGSFQIDTLPRALLFVLPGAVVVVLAVALLSPLRSLWRRLTLRLLGGPPEAELPSELVRAQRRRALALHAAAYATLNLILVVIWALTSGGYFWPEWTLIALGLPLAVHAWVELVDERPDLVQRNRLTRAQAMHEGIAASLALFFVLIWAVTGHGYFWPLWPIIAIALAFTAHAVAELARRNRRITVLETTRAGAVDLQAEELRRIERDLHDGAQARLVALGMSLGMAEQKLGSDPDAAQALLADARRGAHEALEELRDLARGIHPPVLTDRGLEAAVAALADRTPLSTSVAVDVTERPSPPVETAAYYVVAEALANAAKHAHATHVDITVRRKGDDLLVEVVDDGVGDADPAGHGLGGLKQRVEALDGTLTLTSPAGGPTTVRAVMPCAS